MAAPSLCTTALWDEERGLLKEIGFTQRENDEKKRGEEVGAWLTQEEDCLFSTGQKGLSSTFTYGDESGLCELEVMLVCLSASRKQEKSPEGKRKCDMSSINVFLTEK